MRRETHPAGHKPRSGRFFMLKTRWSITACVFLAVTTSASAQTAPVRVGGLTCQTAARVGLLVGSRQQMRCVFRSNATGQTYPYKGTITRVGLDVGVTGGGRLFWGVFAPTSHVGPGTLRGNYVGASGNASLGLGLAPTYWWADQVALSRCNLCPSKDKWASIWPWELQD